MNAYPGESPRRLFWLLHLRWVAVAGQLVTIGVADLVLNVSLPVVPLLVVVGWTAATNLVLEWWHPSSANWHRTVLPALIMAFDLLALTLLLGFSGGVANPFSIFYIVNLALAAVMLPPRVAWSLTVLAGAGLLGCAAWHEPLPELDRVLVNDNATGDAVRLREAGAVIGLLASSMVVVWFITRVNRELRERERDLRQAQRRRSRSQRLEALGTLAAGAGHELATPLSTIAVASKELARHLEGLEVPRIVLDDVGLIRTEVDRCRVILDRMSGSAGQVAGEPWSRVTVEQLMTRTLEDLAARDRVDWQPAPATRDLTCRVPLQSVALALRGVLQNALDASPADCRVLLSADYAAPRLRVSVEDRGAGMPNDVLERAGEPFFTTKGPGHGMGLGLFLSRSICERLGGKLTIVSQAGIGTRVILEFQIDELSGSGEESSDEHLDSG